MFKDAAQTLRLPLTVLKERDAAQVGQLPVTHKHTFLKSGMANILFNNKLWRFTGA